MRKSYGFSHIIILLFTLFFLKVTETCAAEYWPKAQWRTASPESQGMSFETLSNILTTLVKQKSEIDSVIILRNGYVVLEAHNNLVQPHFRHQIYSCTKSFSSALIGIAVDKGFIQPVDQTLLSFFPEKTPSAQYEQKRDITLKDVLMMATGLKCEDNVAYNFNGLKEMWRLDDWVQYMN